MIRDNPAGNAKINRLEVNMHVFRIPEGGFWRRPIINCCFVAYFQFPHLLIVYHEIIRLGEFSCMYISLQSE
ncbi:MAG: hypothetical protein ACOC2F_03075, partial [Bacteroidota bacterium]